MEPIQEEPERPKPASIYCIVINFAFICYSSCTTIVNAYSLYLLPDCDFLDSASQSFTLYIRTLNEYVNFEGRNGLLGHSRTFFLRKLKKK